MHCSTKHTVMESDNRNREMVSVQVKKDFLHSFFYIFDDFSKFRSAFGLGVLHLAIASKMVINIIKKIN